MGGQANRELFGTLMYGLAVELRTQLSQEQLEVMWLGIKDFTREEIERATRRAVLTCKHFPNVAELRALAGKPIQRLRHGAHRRRAGRLEVWIEGAGWGEFHGPASFFEDDGPSPIGDGMEELLRLEPPTVVVTRERGR